MSSSEDRWLALAAIANQPLLDTTTGAMVRRADLTPSQVYERGPDGDQYRYQPIVPDPKP